jgi:hypothetical protein
MCHACACGSIELGIRKMHLEPNRLDLRCEVRGLRMRGVLGLSFTANGPIV